MLQPEKPTLPGESNGRDPFRHATSDVWSRGKRAQQAPVVTVDPGATLDLHELNTLVGLSVVTAHLSEYDCDITFSGGKKLSLSMDGKRGLVVKIHKVADVKPAVNRGAQRRPTATTPNASLLSGIKGLEDEQ